MKIYAYVNLFKGGLSDETKLKEYAKTHKYEIVCTYSDDTLYSRDGICKLLHHIEKSDIKTILVYSLDHLWSDEELHYILVSKLKQLQAEIICITEWLYGVYKDDIAKEGNSIAKYLKMLLPSVSSVKLTQGRIRRGTQGHKPCGTAPLGYMWNNNGDILVNEDEAYTVNEIFNQYLYHKSLSKLAEYLKNHDFQSRNNKPFSKGALQKILHNDFYIGIVTYKNEKYNGTHTPIIGKELFYEVNSLLISNIKCTDK